MIDYVGALGEKGKIYNDEEPIFYDGNLLIISESGNLCTATKLSLEPQYDNPLSLDDIAEQYPYVKKVLYDSWRSGMIFNYMNHKDGEPWELVGTTIGFV